MEHEISELLEENPVEVEKAPKELEAERFLIEMEPYAGILSELFEGW